MSLVPVDPTNALAVSDYLTRARDWLATAVERTGPTEIAAAKAEIATAAEATKQLGLSQEIQLDAKEMVRRAEFALGKAIRKGQAEGTVAVRGQRPSSVASGELSRVADFGTDNTMYGTTANGGTGILALAEAEPDDFEDALTEAKAEGNLSRANVARKAAEKSGAEPAKPRRRPLPDVARDAGWDLRKAIERIERIAADDRFTANAEQVTPHLRSHLTNAIEVCQDLLDRINNN